MWTARTQSLRRCQVSSSKFSGSCGFSVSPQERDKGGGKNVRQRTSPASCVEASSGRVQGCSACDGGKLTLLQGDRQLLDGLGSSPTSLGSPPASSSSKHSPCALLHIFSPQIPLPRHSGELRRALGRRPPPHERHQLPAMQITGSMAISGKSKSIVSSQNVVRGMIPWRLGAVFVPAPWRHRCDSIVTGNS
jgi:hypothetical protein